MIRRLVVPPLEALRPFLPQVNSADTATRDTVARILQRVAADGDRAVRACTLELDGHVHHLVAAAQVRRADTR